MFTQQQPKEALMTTFKVYQIELNNEVYDFVNTDGESHTSAGEKYPEYKAKLETMMGFEDWSDSYFKHYRHVCDVQIEGNDLEDVFVSLNAEDDSASVVKHAEFHSLSTGDIVEDAQGNFHFCDKWGFKKFTNPAPLQEVVVLGWEGSSLGKRYAG
tara:strand:+ start:2147 stop:2614 length:468 start_codon:yes stop_codon:yes gene_type:complete